MRIKDLNLFKFLIIHQCLSKFRKARLVFILTSITIGIILVGIWSILAVSVPPEYSLFTLLITLVIDYTFKFIWGHSNVNVIPYWSLPFNKEYILRGLLFFDVISPWTVCSIITLIYFSIIHILPDSSLNNNSTVFFISYIVLVVLNSYYTLFIRTLQSSCSYLLYLLFLVMVVLLYLLLLLSNYFILLIIPILICFMIIDYRLIKEVIYKQFDQLNF